MSRLGLVLALSLAACAAALAARLPSALAETPALKLEAPAALPILPDLLSQQSAFGPGLVPYEEPGWFRIGAPQGWRVSADRASGRIAVTSQDGRGVHLWLLLVPRTVSGQEASALLGALAQHMAPHTRWSLPRAHGRGERIAAVMQGIEDGYPLAAGLSAVNSDRVALVFFALAYAPQAAFASSRDTFAAVLESFLPLPGEGTRGSGVALSYQQWSDPYEKAFWFDAPRGWTVRGGVARKSAVDVRSVVQLASPDGSVLIQAGDAEIPPFVEPWGSLQEGQQSGPAIVRRYRPGAESAYDYVMWRLKPRMPDLTVEAAQPLPQLQQALQAMENAGAAGGVVARVDVGEVRFRGTWNGKPARGHVYATTRRLSVQGGGSMWFTGDLGSLQGFVAAEDQIATVVAVTNRMRETFTINPQWFYGQQRTTAEVSRITAEVNRYVSNLISRSYAARQQSQDRVFERYARYQRGIVQVADPQTQSRYDVQTGSNYYWISDRGLIVGTDTHFNPDPLWFRQMLQVAP